MNFVFLLSSHGQSCHHSTYFKTDEATDDPDEAMKTSVAKIRCQTQIDLLLLATAMKTTNFKELTCQILSLFLHLLHRTAEEKTQASHGKSKPATKIKKVFLKNIKSPLMEISV